QRGLNENPEAQGTVRLLISVGPSGAVSSVTVVPSGNLPASVIACVQARARAAVFDPPEGSPTIQVPVTFVSQPADPPGLPPGFGPRPRPRAVDDVAVTRPGDELWVGQGQAALDKLQTELRESPQSRKR